MDVKEITECVSTRFKWLYSEVPSDQINSIKSKHNLPYPLAEVLLKRGYENNSEIEEYFTSPLNSLLNPFLMKGMKEGVERICRAIKGKEKICIYGDYDVDGVTSTSLLYLFFKELSCDISYYIPNRLEEGYGLNCSAVEELSEKGVQLIITVDCGISAVNEVKRANELGIDVVVTDHHQQADELPEAVAIINPMQDDDVYPFKSLAGVGVAFKLCMAVRHQLRSENINGIKLPNLKQYLDIVTLGTIADVVPLKGENRTFVFHGLSSLSSNTSVRPGIEELKKVSNVNGHKLTSSHIGFGLAPRINAVGRLGASDRGIRLLITSDKGEAKRLAAELDMENKYRQGIERKILDEVFNKIDDETDETSSYVLHSPGWHPGVLGIVASRVADKFYKPAIILTNDDGEILKGSARSIPGFHLYDGLKELSDLLISFGGHKYAAGLKLYAKDFDELKDRFDKLVNIKLAEECPIPELIVDAYIDAKDINNSFISALERFEPYGNGNREPVFCMQGVDKYMEPSFVGKGSAHLKCFFAKDNIVFDCIGYDMADYADILHYNTSFDIVFSLSNNGRYRSFQLILKDIRACMK